MKSEIQCLIWVFLFSIWIGGCTLSRSFIFPAPTHVHNLKVGSGEWLVDTTNREQPIYAYYLPARDGFATLAWFHGNGQQVADLEPLIEALGQTGLGFFAVEYPGYGFAEVGTASESSLYSTSSVALRLLVEKWRVPCEKLVLVGQSLGTGVAVEMAKMGFGDRVILISPFTSIDDVAKSWISFLPVTWLVHDSFDNASKAPNVAQPVLIVHGTCDDIVPYEMGERLATLFPHARLFSVKDAPHNGLFARSGSLREIVAFSSGDTSRLSRETLPVRKRTQ